jgi:hypothetical protein
MEMPYVHAASYESTAFGDDCDMNKLFLMYLFSDKAVDNQFLKDVGLLRSKVTCNTCGYDMS